MTGEGRPKPRRDRYGRYLIPDPQTGREVAWTRATTLAETLDDRYNLELWKLRTCAVGLARRPDLLAMVAAHHDDKQQLNRVCADALEAGKASEGANLGTALHALTEQVDRGEDIIALDALQADIDAYRQAITRAGLRIATLPDGRLAREVIVLCPQLGVAGTADHLFDADGRLIVGDLKTGAGAIEWAMTSIAIQLAVYAHATHIWDPATGTLSEKPATDTDTAIVIHLPVGQGVCTLHDVDITAGWEAAQHAVWVRRWRKRRDLSTPRLILPASESTPVDEVSPRVAAPATFPLPTPPAGTSTPEPAQTTAMFPRVEWIGDRISKLPAAARRMLALRWPDGTPTVRQMRAAADRDYHDSEVEAIETVLAPIERDHECPFPPADPGRPTGPGYLTAAAAQHAPATTPSATPTTPTVDDQPDEGGVASDGDIAAIVDAFDRLSDRPDSTGLSPRAQGRAWLRQMAAAGRPLELTRVRTRRRLAVARAVVRLAVYDDEIARAVIARVLGRGIDESEPTGVALWSLTIGQADEVVSLVDALVAGTATIAYDDNGACRVDVTHPEAVNTR